MKKPKTTYFSTWAARAVRATRVVSRFSILLACLPTASWAWEWTKVSNFDALPQSEGWTGPTAGPQGLGTASVENGILHLGSPEGRGITWEDRRYPGTFPALTYEIRFKVVTGSKNGCQLIYFCFGDPNQTLAINAEPGGLRNHWVTEGYSSGSNIILDQDMTDDFHTMHLAIVSTPSPQFSVWVDPTGEPGNGYIGTFANGFRPTTWPTFPVPAWISFGAGFQSDSEFFIDYIRYSTEGAFDPLPEPPHVAIRLSQVEVCWDTKTNEWYQLQYRSSLTTDQWTPLAEAWLAGTGMRYCTNDAVQVSQPQRFYRVAVTNSPPYL